MSWYGRIIVFARRLPGSWGVPFASLLGALGTLGGCGASTASERVQQSETVPPREPTIAIRLLGFNDFHGQLASGRKVSDRPVGGAVAFANHLEASRRGFENGHLIVHAGDLVGASPPESGLLQDEPTIQFVNLLANEHCVGPAGDDPRCNVVGAPGNHEFDEGRAEMLRLIAGGNHAKGPFLVEPYPGARFPYVCANVVQSDGKPLLPPYVVREVRGLKVGVIGAVLKETPSIVVSAGVEGLTFLDEVTAINAQVTVLKREGVKAIVVSIHQGAAQTPVYATPTDPSASVGAPIDAIVSRLDDEVDVVISGHAHSFTNALVRTASGHEVLLVQAFHAGSAFDEVDLVLDSRTGEVLHKTARVVTTFADEAPGNAPNPGVQALVDRAKAATAPLVNRPVATLAADITRTQNEAGESALGNLLADAQRAAMGTDFAFMNPGGMRTDLAHSATSGNPADAEGRVLWGELFSLQPFGNNLVRMTLTGQQVYDLLNQQFAVNRFLQVSGLAYTWDASKPTTDRVVEVRQGGAPIDRARSYTVTANNFIATGGDGFTVFLQGKGAAWGPIDLDALVMYLSALQQPVVAPVLDRIARVN